MNHIVAIAGTIGSGKSTLSHALVEATGWKYGSFGNVVRVVAQEKGLDSKSRKVLQQVGQNLVIEDSEHFCQLVLEHSQWKTGDGLIIDGIRHSEILDVLNKLVIPDRVKLVYISLDDETRRSRILERGSDKEMSITLIDQDVTEDQVKGTLFEAADLVVQGNQSIKKNIRIITRWLVEAKNIRP